MYYKSYRNQMLCFWLRGQEVFRGPQIFFEKDYLSKFFVAKVKKILFTMSQKLLYT